MDKMAISASSCSIPCHHRTLGSSPNSSFVLKLQQNRRNSRCRHVTTSCSASPAEAFGVTESGAFSISDDVLRSRGLQFHSTRQGLDLDQLNSLFVKVGFPRRQKEKLDKALQHTSSLQWLEEVKSNNMVAFARATGDDVFNAIIWDVVVDPSYQGLGLGKAIMERLMVDLLQKGITNICLYAEPNVVGFYKPLGYIPDPQGIRAMSYSKRKA